MIFQDKLTLQAQKKASLNAPETNFQREEVEVKRKIWRLKVIREKELYELLKGVTKDRIRYQVGKRATEMEILALQYEKLIL